MYFKIFGYHGALRHLVKSIVKKSCYLLTYFTYHNQCTTNAVAETRLKSLTQGMDQRNGTFLKSQLTHVHNNIRCSRQ